MLTSSCSSQNHYQDDTCTGLSDAGETQDGWHVLWTRSNCEQMVRDQLAAKQYEVFLPLISRWATGDRRGKGSPVYLTSMFKGYLFLRHKIDRTAYLDISNTKGLVQILGVRWNQLAQVPEAELESIKRAVDSREHLLPYPYLKAGSMVRVIRGTLTNARGILVQTDLAKGLFVVSIRLLQRSIAMKVNCSDVVPV